VRAQFLSPAALHAVIASVVTPGPRRAAVDSSSMRVLATGGAGYVGSHCVRALRRAGHEVEILDDLSRGHRQFAERLAVPLHVADLRDLAATEKVLRRGYDAVLTSPRSRSSPRASPGPRPTGT